jgi:hypothetical protein
MVKSWMMNRAGFCRCVALIIAGWTGFFGSGRANLAYLPAVGPAPLRFQPDFKPVKHIVATPPPEPAQAAAPVAPAKAQPVAPTPAPEPTPVVVQPAAVVEPPKPDGVVSPQMLLKYFNRGTNADAATSPPAGFTPPGQIEPPSSKASYSTPQH